MEPDFIAQTGEAKTPEEGRAWVKRMAKEFKAKGATHGRYTIDRSMDPPTYLVEAWKVCPEDEGRPRFSYGFAPGGSGGGIEGARD